MKNVLLIILVFLTLVLGCSKDSGTSKTSEPGIFGDETQDASKLILEANDELKKVKAIYKANKNRSEELKAAMAQKDIEKVKTTLNDLVLQINDGLVSGESAYSKIEKAEAMDINSTYKEYLELKKDSLRKHLDAFELRRQVAQSFRNSFGGKDPKALDQAQAELTEKENEFQKLIDEGRDLSKEANDLYEKSMEKTQ